MIKKEKRGKYRENINILNEFYFKILYKMKKDTKKMKIPIINENSIN